jgi:ADP-ribosylglycohydrolase
MEYPEVALRALLGQAVGDAFGAPFEYSKRAAEMSAWSMAEGRYLDSVNDVGNRAKWARIPGLYTDDTQQALALLHACSETDDWLDGLAAGDAFIEVVAKMSEAWVPGSLAGVHRGTGRNFREFVRTRSPIDTAGMGAAMRIGPAATMLPGLSEVLTWSVTVSQTTTTNPIALTAAAIYAAHCHAIAHQQEDGLTERIIAWLDSPACAVLGIERAFWRETLRAIVVFNDGGEQELLAYAKATGLANKPMWCAANGFALTGLPWVLHHARAPSFPDALIGACSSGGDCDTVAAMVGCISILRYGIEGIPIWMCDQLVGLPLLLDPHGWDPIKSELPMTQREETYRRETLIQEFQSHRAPPQADPHRIIDEDHEEPPSTDEDGALLHEEDQVLGEEDALKDDENKGDQLTLFQ